MDAHFLDGLGTLLAFIGFVSVCIWAYSSKRKQRFEEDAKLPFADEESTEKTTSGAEADTPLNTPPDTGDTENTGNRKNSGE